MLLATDHRSGCEISTYGPELIGLFDAFVVHGDRYLGTTEIALIFDDSTKRNRAVVFGVLSGS